MCPYSTHECTNVRTVSTNIQGLEGRPALAVTSPALCHAANYCPNGTNSVPPPCSKGHYRPLSPTEPRPSLARPPGRPDTADMERQRLICIERRGQLQEKDGPGQLGVIAALRSAPGHRVWFKRTRAGPHVSFFAAATGFCVRSRFCRLTFCRPRDDSSNCL